MATPFDIDPGSPVQRIAHAAQVFAHRVDTDWNDVQEDMILRNELQHVEALLRYLLGGNPTMAGKQLERIDENYLLVLGGRP
jgi:hypothetical protein